MILDRYIKLRLGAQSVTLLSTLRDPTQLRRRQCATRQQHPFLLHIVVLFRAFNISKNLDAYQDILHSFKHYIGRRWSTAKNMHEIL